jgi:hypothetical protein
LNLYENDKKIEFKEVVLKKNIFSKSDLFYYVQVIVKIFKIEPDIKLMDTILSYGAEINYLNEYKENVLFKVRILL